LNNSFAIILYIIKSKKIKHNIFHKAIESHHQRHQESKKTLL